MHREKYKRNSHCQLVTIVQLSGFRKKFFLPRKAFDSWTAVRPLHHSLLDTQIRRLLALFYVLVFRSMAEKEEARLD